MLTPEKLLCLTRYTCPGCGAPLGRYHAYPVDLETLLSRLTEAVPMHLQCAQDLLGLQPDNLSAIWTVKSSSPDSPSARLFNKAKGDAWLFLFSPDSLTLQIAGRAASYAEVEEQMLPQVRQAVERAASPEEVSAITEQVAWLHRYLPRRPRPDNAPH